MSGKTNKGFTTEYKHNGEAVDSNLTVKFAHTHLPYEKASPPNLQRACSMNSLQSGEGMYFLTAPSIEHNGEPARGCSPFEAL
jgi:hypothetical protein